MVIVKRNRQPETNKNMPVRNQWCFIGENLQANYDDDTSQKTETKIMGTIKIMVLKKKKEQKGHPKPGS